MACKFQGEQGKDKGEVQVYMHAQVLRLAPHALCGGRC